MYRNNNLSTIVLFLFIILMIGGLVYSFIIYKNMKTPYFVETTNTSKIDVVEDTSDNTSEPTTDNIIEEKEEIKYEITDSYESDSNIIEKTFMKGMDSEEYKKLFNKKTMVINKTSEYEKISYDFEKKLHYSDLEKIYESMSNSDVVSVEIIGKSVDNRNIYGITIGKGDKVLFLDANIHAAEVSTTLVLTKFLGDILNDYELNDKNIVEILNNVKIAAIPCLNPDGYEVYNYGISSINNKDLWIYKNKGSISFDNIKSNANGVDLNRNFPTQNVGMYYKGKELKSNTSLKKTTEKGKYYNGDTAGSEPEIKAAMYFMLKHYKNTYAYINLHSQGRVLYAGKPNLSDEFNNISATFAKKISGINSYKVHGLSSEEVGEGNDGSATDFMAELANGLVFSTKTGRLSTDKYINNSCSLKYSYPVITMEITKVWSKDPSYSKSEYYDYGLKKVLYSILEND